MVKGQDGKKAATPACAYPLHGGQIRCWFYGF